jgi:hypothetical protein
MSTCIRSRRQTQCNLPRWKHGCIAALLFANVVHATSAETNAIPSNVESESLASALSQQAWTRVEQSIERALAWLARQQKADGSFEAPDSAQPAATSFAIMAYLSKGHLPGEGPYGRQIDLAIDYVLRLQQPNGLLAAGSDNSNVSVEAQFQVGTVPTSSKTANYNHAISGLMLTEVYGMTDRTRAAKLKPAIVKALGFSRRVQTLPKSSPQDKGGWRYLNTRASGDSDLSVTSWELMFFRSARNAEFTVPKEFVDDAVGYVLRCWEETQGIFYYKKSGNEQRWSRGMVGAGVLSLAMAGQHQTRVAQRAGDWLLSRPLQRFGETVGSGDRFYYSAYYCSQAMAQLGGRYWKQFFPSLVNVLLQSQQSSGEWPPEPYGSDRMFGNTYTTAMAVLSLTPPLQLLPVYQR